MNRKILIGIVVCLWIGLAGLIYFLWMNIKPAYKGTLIEPPSLAENFTLHSDKGDIHLSDYHGKVVLLYFGYTFCPDVCPITLAKVSRAFQLLGKNVDKVQTIFISVDPERDTPELLGRYARAFNRDFIGATSTPDIIDDIAKKYGVFHQKQSINSAGDYHVDHTSVIFVINSNGKLRLVWPYGLESPEMVSDLNMVLSEDNTK